MTETDKELAERVLRHLLQGADVIGLRFQTPQLLFDGRNDLPGDVALNFESRWALFDQRPYAFPKQEDELPDISHEEELQILLRLSGKTVSSVEILSPPHLVLTFDDGSILFVNGHHDMYETWQIGQIPHDKDVWLVVACPGGGLAVWAADDF